MKRLEDVQPAFTHTFPAVREKKAQEQTADSQQNKGHRCDRGPVDDTIEEPHDRQPERTSAPLPPAALLWNSIAQRCEISSSGVRVLEAHL